MAPVARHLPGPGIGVVKPGIERPEPEAEEPPGAVEGRADHRVEAEIGLQLGLVEVMLRHSALLGIVAPVPGFEVAVDPVGMHHRGQHPGVRLGLRPRRFPDPHQEVAHIARRLRHLGFELVGRETLVAEKPRALLAEVQDFGGERPVVGRPAVRPARNPGLVGDLAQIAARRELQERHHERPAEGQDMTVPPALLRRRLRAGDDEIRQTVEVGPGQGQDPVPLVSKKVLGEGGGQNRQPLLHLGNARAPRRVERGTGADEHAPVKLQHTGLLGRQVKTVPPLPERLDPREKRRVHRHFGGERRHLRRKIALQRLALRRRIRSGEVVEHPRHAIERLLGQFQRLDRVGEGRRLRRPGDCRDIRPRLGQRRVEGGGEIGVADRVEGRQGEGARPGGEKRVGHGDLLCRES